MLSACSVGMLGVVVAVVAGCTMPVPCSSMGGKLGEVVLCMSSIRFTLDVLDLVFMVGAGDGEMGGDGESSPFITGMDRRGGPMVWLVVWMEGWAMFRVLGAGRVVPVISVVDSVSSSYCGSGRVLGGGCGTWDSSYWFSVAWFFWIHRRGVPSLGSWCWYGVGRLVPGKWFVGWFIYGFAGSWHAFVRLGGGLYGSCASSVFNWVCVLFAHCAPH